MSSDPVKVVIPMENNDKFERNYSPSTTIAQLMKDFEMEKNAVLRPNYEDEITHQERPLDPNMTVSDLASKQGLKFTYVPKKHKKKQQPNSTPTGNYVPIPSQNFPSNPQSQGTIQRPDYDQQAQLRYQQQLQQQQNLQPQQYSQISNISQKKGMISGGLQGIQGMPNTYTGIQGFQGTPTNIPGMQGLQGVQFEGPQPIAPTSTGVKYGVVSERSLGKWAVGTPLPQNITKQIGQPVALDPNMNFINQTGRPLTQEELKLYEQQSGTLGQMGIGNPMVSLDQPSGFPTTFTNPMTHLNKPIGVPSKHSNPMVSMDQQQPGMPSTFSHPMVDMNQPQTPFTGGNPSKQPIGNQFADMVVNDGVDPTKYIPGCVINGENGINIPGLPKGVPVVMKGFDAKTQAAFSSGQPTGCLLVGPGGKPLDSAKYGAIASKYTQI